MKGNVRLKRTLLWVIALRAGAVTGLFVGATLSGLRAVPERFAPLDPFFTLIAVTYALTALYTITLNAALSRRWMVDLQLAVDALLVTAVVALTGGVQSYFVSLYALPIVAASALQFRQGGVLLAAGCIACYGGLVALQYQTSEGAQLALLPPLRSVYFTVILNASGFLAIAALTAFLASDLRSTGQRLERASMEIADLQAFNHWVIDSLTGGLATTDLDGRVLTFNRAATAITGLPSDRARHRLIADVLQLPASFHGPLAAIVATGGSQRLEVRFRRADGAELDLGYTAAPLVAASGPAGYIFSFQDVTAAKQLERDAQRQKRLAALGEMAAGIAHEIRNPLASICGSIQVLRQELPLNSEQSLLMDIVVRESERLNETIGDFLAYARPQRRTTGRVNLAALVDEAARLVRHSPECGAHHTVLVDVAPGGIWMVEGDESQVRQVIWNLASNGLRAMPDGGTLRLALAAGAPGRIWLTVADEGVGIPHDRLDSIFQPFSSSFATGTGLGLAIVHRIVNDSGGTIVVSSQPGEGTTMRVELPASSTTTEDGRPAGLDAATGVSPAVGRVA